MTLIDVDGYLEPQELALVGAAAAARAIRRLDIGGSIGIDLPTVESRQARLAAAKTIDDHSPAAIRTHGGERLWLSSDRAAAKAGFAVWNWQRDRAPFEARALLRRAASELPGPKTPRRPSCRHSHA